MKRLLLLRHGKSDWNNPDQPDIERPLNSRGQRAAALMGAYMRQRAMTPDLILSSSAVRTRETAQRVLAALEAEVPLEFVPALYLAEPKTIIDTVCAAPDTVGTLLLVGHNPGMQLAALKLSGRNSSGRRGDIEDKFPTAALAVIEFDAATWSGARDGDLVAFEVPKALV
ncbi:histidine phosphatase family protein [Iodidimonas sp. SYSU 1G8]|uniref:SixA phosphatase family protein n=1 Tax=Iodidimonas sp. SYSU 1G8 TaxID=3133967 RepID=UPI0031FEE23F